MMHLKHSERMEPATLPHFGERNMKIFLTICALFSLVISASAQTDTVGNKYIYASMDDGSGQFTIINQANSNNHYLYGDGQTSHINIRFHLGSGADTVVTNSIFTSANNPNFALPAGQISADSVRKSHDTLTAYYWQFGYLVRERVHPVFGPNNVSGQIMVEFISEQKDTNTNNVIEGILWEADVALNSDATGCNTGGDKPVILTSN